MYRLIACDIDGTLITSEFEISQRTKRAVKAAEEKGVEFILTSGRIFGSARFYARQLEQEGLILCCNGSVAKNAGDEKLIFADPIEKEVCAELFRILQKDDTYFQFYGEEIFYAPYMVEEALFFRDWAQTLPEKDRIPVVHAKNPYEILEKDAVYKIYIKSAGEASRRYHEKIFGTRDDIVMTSSWNTNFEINGKNVSKAGGVLKYGEMLGIGRQEIICIGDNYNDEQMIKAAGLGVAMGNAPQEVREVADYVTDTNDCDGVAKVLEEFVL